jgi:hypothetical protein
VGGRDGTFESAAMTYKSCPTAIVNAPIEVVWEILTEPAAWGAFFDVRIIDVQPKGSALVGQRIYAESGPRFLRLRLKFQFTEVNTVEHKLRLNIELPFSISVREDLNCIPLSCTQCRVSYNCNFGFPSGSFGAIARVVLRREIDAGPADSLSRLKRAAERQHASGQA